MAHAFTPGLKVRRKAHVRKERILPLQGEVQVKKGDWVRAEQVVAKTELPGDVELIRVAQKLGIPPADLPSVMKKKVGEPVEKDEVIAEARALFGLLRTEIRSPLKGSIQNISQVTGQVVIQGEPHKVQLHAYIDGKVTAVYPNEGVRVEAVATYVQAIFGVGRERWGVLRIIGRRDRPLEKEDLPADAEGAILVGGSLVRYEVIQEAITRGAVGIVSGGILDADLRRLLGYDIGVAITGTEDIPLTLAITEGFGEIPIAERTWEYLKARDGERASVHGATQIRAGVVRPEVIVPYEGEDPEEFQEERTREESGLMEVGTRVRIIRDPYFGKIGEVIALPVEPVRIVTESRVRVLTVRLPDGEEVTLPRANVEIYEA